MSILLLLCLLPWHLAAQVPTPEAVLGFRVGADSQLADWELVTAQALVRLAAREHAAFVSRFLKLGRRAVEAGRTGQPQAYVIPTGQRDEGARAQFANLLIADGVEIRRATRIPAALPSCRTTWRGGPCPCRWA